MDDNENSVADQNFQQAAAQLWFEMVSNEVENLRGKVRELSGSPSMDGQVFSDAITAVLEQGFVSAEEIAERNTMSAAQIQDWTVGKNVPELDLKNDQLTLFYKTVIQAMEKKRLVTVALD